MIKATKHSVKQIRDQMSDGQSRQFHRYTKMVLKFQKYVLAIIITVVIVRAVRAYLMYLVLDDFLRVEYKMAYTHWSELRKGPNAKVSSLASREKEKAVKYEFDEARKYEELEEFWSTYGPFADAIFILTTVCVCSGVLTCLNKYRKNLD